MTGAAQANKNPLERTIQSWVDWGVGASGGGVANFLHSRQSDEAVFDADDLDEDAGWEARLRQQNAANDELCSENGRLRAEIERLRVETKGAIIAADNEEEPASARMELGNSSLDEELLQEVLAGVQEVLVRWKKTCKVEPAITVGSDPEESFDEHKNCKVEDDVHVLPCVSSIAIETSDETSKAGVKQDIDFTNTANVPNDTGSSAHDGSNQCMATEKPGLTGCDPTALCSKMEDKQFALGNSGTEEDVPLETTDTDRNSPGDPDASGTAFIPDQLREEEDEDVDEEEEKKVEEDRCIGDSGNAGKVAETCCECTPEEAVESEMMQNGGDIDANELDKAWPCDVSAVIEAGMRAAFQEDLESSGPASALTPAEETAVLVGEKIALRELVEKQQDRIEVLEDELREADTALLFGGGMLDAGGGPSSGALLMKTTFAKGLSDAGDALSAVSTVFAAKPAAKIAVPGTEYEVVGRRGVVVRREESLRSGVIQKLSPGSLVRVVSISDNYPRRVEILCVKANVEEETAPASIQEDNSEAAIDQTQNDSSDTQAPSAPVPVVGWISACTKDNTMLIRPVPLEANTGDGGDQSQEAIESREEGNEEVTHVTLSAHEWDCLHQDNEASLRQVEQLTQKLNEMGSELLQSFEMRSVLGELKLGVARARERLEWINEAAAMAHEELLQRWLDIHMRRALPVEDAGTDTVLVDVVEEETPRSQLTSDCSPCNLIARSNSLRSNESVDWDRLLSERETTAAALYTALQRLATLEREEEELREEQIVAEKRGHDKLRGLRSMLRKGLPKFLGGTSADRGDGNSSSSTTASSTVFAGEDLFKHRLKELQNNVASLRDELNRAAMSEADLRRSIEARSDALKGLLHRSATAGLNPPQCGPLKLPVSAEAELQALRIAVEEQLHWNLQLRRDAVHQQSTSNSKQQKQTINDNKH